MPKTPIYQGKRCKSDNGWKFWDYVQTLRGPLIWGCVEPECDYGPISGGSMAAARSAREVMGLRSNPFWSVGRIAENPLAGPGNDQNGGAAAEATGLDNI